MQYRSHRQRCHRSGRTGPRLGATPVGLSPKVMLWLPISAICPPLPVIFDACQLRSARNSDCTKQFYPGFGVGGMRSTLQIRNFSFAICSFWHFVVTASPYLARMAIEMPGTEP